MASQQQIITEIDAHIQESGYEYREWYVGITGDIEQRLFGAHSVPRKNHWRIHKEADSSAIARRIEQHFLARGCKGGGGGGDDTSCWVYAYLITLQTRE